MFTVSSIQSVVDNYFLFLGYEISLHVKVDLMDMLYQKSLRVSVDVRNTRGIGAMLNLQSNDASNVWQMPVNVHTLWSSPLQVSLPLVLAFPPLICPLTFLYLAFAFALVQRLPVLSAAMLLCHAYIL